MRLSEIRIQNFRSFDDEVIRFDDYTCLVGPNGSGKSTVLMALNVFFKEQASTVTDVRTLSLDDFHHKRKERPVRVTLTLADLSAAAQEEWKGYYRQGKLVLFAEARWDDAGQSAPVKHYGSRLVMEEFAPFFEAEREKKTVAELRPIYKEMRAKFVELPNVPTKKAMCQALREYEETHPERCVPVDEPNQCYGFTGGDYRLNPYIQWVYVPAVKDASSEQDEGTKTALGQLLARTVRTKLNFADLLEGFKAEVEKKYAEILENQKSALKGLELSMQQRLRDYVNERARLGLSWHRDAKTSVNIRDPLARAEIGDADFIGEVARAGHGMQRGFLLAILHEMAQNDKTHEPRLLLGFEEPELYQHPPQAQHLADVLERLSLPGNNAQIVVTTHSPYFVTAKGFENVRMFRKCPSAHCSKVSATTYEDVERRLRGAPGAAPLSAQSLMAIIGQIMHPSQRELFFTHVAVIVEGPEDVAFIASHLKLSGNWPTFRGLGCHFVVAGGKDNVARFLAIAQALNVPAFAVFDSDNVALQKRLHDTLDDTEKHKSAKASCERNSKTNSAILRLCGMTMPEQTLDVTLWGENVAMWPDHIRYSVLSDVGERVWQGAEEKVRVNSGLQDGVKQKNAMLIAATMEELSRAGRQSASLVKLCGKILDYAQRKETQEQRKQ